MLRTQYKMFIFLSAQYRSVNYRENVVEQISRTYSFCTTETFYNFIFEMQSLWKHLILESKIVESL